MMRWLIVDDDQAFLEQQLKPNMERIGHDVSICFTLKDAQVLIDNNEYDIVLVDVLMPREETGIDFVMRNKDKCKEIYPFTGHLDHDLVQSKIKQYGLSEKDVVEKEKLNNGFIWRKIFQESVMVPHG